MIILLSTLSELVFKGYYIVMGIQATPTRRESPEAHNCTQNRGGETTR